MKTKICLFLGVLTVLAVAYYYASSTYKLPPRDYTGVSGKSDYYVCIPGVTYLKWMTGKDKKVNVAYHVAVPTCKGSSISPILNKYDNGILGKIYFNPQAWHSRDTNEIWVASADGICGYYFGLNVDPRDEKKIMEIVDTVKAINEMVGTGCKPQSGA